MARTSTLDTFLLALWALLLVLSSSGGPARISGMGGEEFPGGDPHQPGGGSFHHPRRGVPQQPRFTPIAQPFLVAPIGAPPLGPVTLPSTPNLPGAFGQGSSAFLPAAPASVGVSPPAVLLIPQGGLGVSSTNAFVPPLPQMPTFPVAGNAPQAAPGQGPQNFVPFALGPTAILNQFVQPPLVPFGQVGVPSQSYLPGFFSGNANPFNRSCNYYYFAGCGSSGGAEADFNFSTR